MKCVGMVNPQQGAVLYGKSISRPSDILSMGIVKLQSQTRQLGVSLISLLLPGREAALAIKGLCTTDMAQRRFCFCLKHA